MKRRIAPRKLKHCCDSCNKPILKGYVYYTKRNVWEGDGEIIAWTKRTCARCQFKIQERSERFQRFKPNCHHPEKMINEVWSYIPGEYVMQPDHDECLVCGEWVL